MNLSNIAEFAQAEGSEAVNMSEESLESLLKSVGTETSKTVEVEEDEASSEVEVVASETPTEDARPAPREGDIEIEQVITLRNLADWFTDNRERFDNVRRANLGGMRGIDSDNYMLLSVLIPDQEVAEGEEPKRFLSLQKDVQSVPTLNLEGESFKIYGTEQNGYDRIEITYKLQDNVYLKCYSERTRITCILCYDHEGHRISLAEFKIKNSEEEVTVVACISPATIAEKLQEEPNIDMISVRYPLIKKAEGFETNLDVLNWFAEKQNWIRDIDHHIKVDRVLMSIFA